MRPRSDFLPEVVPNESSKFPTPQVRPIERESKLGLQVLPGSHIRNSKELPEAVVTFGSETTTTSDDSSTRGLVPSDGGGGGGGGGEDNKTPKERPSLWRRRRTLWIFLIAFVLGILCVVIPVTVVISIASRGDSASNESSSTPTRQGGTKKPTASSTATSTASASSSATPTPTCTNYSGPPLKSLPPKIEGTIPDAGPPPKTVPATLTFKKSYSYDKVSKDGNMQSDIFASIPQGLAFAVDDAVAAIAMGNITGEDTSHTKCYITTSVVAYIPSSAKYELQHQARDKTSKLYNSPNGNARKLFQQIDKISVT